MQAIADLEKQWREQARFRGLHANLGLGREGVLLGSDTVLARRESDGALECDAIRTLTLLAVAYGQPIDPSIVRKFKFASDHARAGNEAMAAMHIALAGLPVLPDPPDAARRLFIADGLIEKGIAPRDIWTALEFDPASLDSLEKFNPDQPRVPKGSGRPSGRWVHDGGPGSEAAIASPAPPIGADVGIAERAMEAAGAAARAASRLIPELVPKILDVISDAAPPVVFASTLLEPSPTGGALLEGDVVGRPDLQFSWREDELAPRVTRKSDGSNVDWFLAPDYKSLVDRKGRVVARIVGRSVIADAVAIPTETPKPGQDDEKPDLCPAPGKDKFGRPNGEKDKDYEDYVKRIINPDNPTARGFGYQLSNPAQGGKLVFYDDCQHKTGMMVEAKGTGYAPIVTRRDGDFMKDTITDDWLDQAKRQVAASHGRDVEWHFAEEEAKDYAEKLFNSKEHIAELGAIKLEFTYWREEMR